MDEGGFGQKRAYGGVMVRNDGALTPIRQPTLGSLTPQNAG
jgi:hypothetical protein